MKKEEPLKDWKHYLGWAILALVAIWLTNLSNEFIEPDFIRYLIVFVGVILVDRLNHLLTLQ